MFLKLVNQVSKLLNSRGDMMQNLNSALSILQEFLPIRNSCILIRDSITNRYYISLAPEISQSEQYLWNSDHRKDANLFKHEIFYKLLLSPGEPDILGLPCPKDLSRLQRFVKYIHPVIYQEQTLPVCLLCFYVTDAKLLPEVDNIVNIFSDMIAMAMVARGVKVNKISGKQDIQPVEDQIFANIIGRNSHLLEIARIIKRISASKATVLIRGESGTGKELIAKAIHENSLNPQSPFISLNCAALPENLMESELFGHEKGAFTGAIAQKKGRFELANGGTIFLDEIGYTSLAFQTKILRVLQEGEFERLGSTKTLKVDVRVLCATNVDLEQAISDGNFREDLYYRINVVAIRVPPLRDRKEDIPLLVNHFLNELNQENGKQIKLSENDNPMLMSRNWPGNVRELENAVHHAFLMEKNGFLFFEISATQSPRYPNSIIKAVESTLPESDLVIEEVREIEKALANCHGIQKKTAQVLGISVRQLRYRIQKYNIIVRKIKPFNS
ncbi:MAG: sigma 54-interacting transcriptional regulator [Deltaproteobacteria bacterium]|jgi:transcriptional regulator with GAF, ATPase, and Fis domain|nr:sigma 54-interacting transcriptional regulator [Deltaproteobacteria bacterium]